MKRLPHENCTWLDLHGWVVRGEVSWHDTWEAVDVIYDEETDTAFTLTRDSVGGLTAVDSVVATLGRFKAGEL